jgi:hypothetical protein
MNQRIAKNIRRTVSRNQNLLLAGIRDHLLSKKPKFIPTFAWDRFLRWILSR